MGKASAPFSFLALARVLMNLVLMNPHPLT
jgi:hypothetical protein